MYKNTFVRPYTLADVGHSTFCEQCKTRSLIGQPKGRWTGNCIIRGGPREQR
jgi:hypothetical protein